MNIQTGKIQTDITDTKLQELTMQTLLPQTDFSIELQALLKPSLIQGIINAEAKRWGRNDHLPSIPDAWGRALFAMSLPVRGIAEKDPIGRAFAAFAVVVVAVAAGVVGFGVAAIAAAIAAADSHAHDASFGVAAFLARFDVVAFLAGAGWGAIWVEVYCGVIGALGSNPNSTVGRGQIGQSAWDDAVNTYGEYFGLYLGEVMQSIGLKKQMEEKLNTYKLNNISVSYNAMDKKNVKVLENFMIGAVLLLKVSGAKERMKGRMEEGRTAEAALKYGIAAYHGVDMNAINKTLGQYGALAFPANAQDAQDAQDARLNNVEQDRLAYVQEVYDYAQSH